MFRAATSQAMTTHAFCDACLLEKIAMQMSFGSKNFCKFCTMFWTPKWRLKNGPKNGARI